MDVSQISTFSKGGVAALLFYTISESGSCKRGYTDVHGISRRSLYAGMGWAAHIAVKALDTSPHLSVRKAASNALVLWYAQFAINMAWTPLFFGAKKVSR